MSEFYCRGTASLPSPLIYLHSGEGQLRPLPPDQNRLLLLQTQPRISRPAEGLLKSFGSWDIFERNLFFDCLFPEAVFAALPCFDLMRCRTSLPCYHVRQSSGAGRLFRQNSALNAYLTAVGALSVQCAEDPS